jgi:hypothetical protein
MFLNVVRPFGNLSLEPSFMRMLMIFMPIANGFSRVCWGYLLDKFSFKPLYLTLIISGVNFISLIM